MSVAWNKGLVKPELRPTEVPSAMDLHWAAGIFEGEGTCGNYGRGVVVGVSQKDRWILDKLRAFFGGRVRAYQARSNGPANDVRAYHRWDLSRTRAEEFLRRIYHLLSPRRQEQITRALSAVGA